MATSRLAAAGAAQAAIESVFVTDPVTGRITFSGGGVDFSVSPVVRSDVSTQVLTLLPGEHRSISLTDGTYWVDSEFDVLVKSSSASACFGAELTNDTDAYSTTPGSLASMTGLDFGASSFSFECWAELDAHTPNSARIIGFGASGSYQMDIYASNASADTGVRLGLDMKTAGGTSIVSDIGSSPITAYPLGSSLYHFAVTIERAAGGGTGKVTYFINGVQVRQATWTENASPYAFNLSSCTAGSSRMAIGATVGGNAEWNGRIEDLKFYNTLLTVSQIQARAAAGPVRDPVNTPLDVADLSLKWWLSFQNSAGWSNPLYPECIVGYGNAVFNTLVGSPAITERSGGAAANTQNSARIRASSGGLIAHAGTYLSLYGDSASGGTVRIAPVA